MSRAHFLTPLIFSIVGTNPIAIVAQGAMEVCDAAHCSEVMKKVSSDKLRLHRSDRCSQPRSA
jgi:hypothetical protein